MDNKTKSASFKAIAHVTSSSFHALRVLVSHIGELADKHDQGTVLAFESVLSKLFPPLDGVVIKTDVPGEIDLKRPSELSAEGPFVPVDPAIEEANTKIKEALRNDDVIFKLIMAVREFSKKPPKQGHLIRQGAITTLFSHFEGALARLIHAFYEQYPQALPAEDRTMTLADLRKVGSVSEAEKLITEKEIDSVLRQNTEEQIAYFRKRLKVAVKSLDDLMPSLVEISQRRNIYVHNDGKVNHQYLASVDQSLAGQYKAEEGKRLLLSTDYLLCSIDTVAAAAMMLIQACWRKWGEPKDADTNLLELTYDGLRDQRYEYVKVLALFAKGADMVEDASRRIVLINHAIALRETGDQDGARKILQEADWSAASLKFSLALHVLLEEKEEFLRLLPRVMAAEEINIDALHEWPLFNPWRGQDWFDRAVTGFAPSPTRSIIATQPTSGADPL